MDRAFRRPCTTLAFVLALAGCGRLLPEFAPAASAGGGGTADAGLIEAAVDGGTRGRISRAARDFAGCRATLQAARIGFSPVPDRVDSEVCGLSQAGTLDIDRGTVARLSPGAPTMSCETALALSVWRRAVERAAVEMLGSEVVQIDHFGTYACRGVNNRPGARPSAHARAAAVDFAGVRLRDGRRITVAADWTGEEAEARFLRRIRDEACRVFGTTLSPEYNAQHYDHLHLAPDGRLCR